MAKLEPERLPTSCDDPGLNRKRQPGFHLCTADRRTPEYLYVKRSTGVVPLGPSDGKVVTTEWSYENGPFAEVDNPSGSVIDILKTDPVGSTGGSG